MLPKKGSGGTLGLLRPPPLSAFKRQLQPFRLSKGHELLHPHTPTVGWPLPCPGAAHRPTFPSTFISPLMAPLLENLGWGRPWRCPQRPEDPPNRVRGRGLWPECRLGLFLTCWPAWANSPDVSGQTRRPRGSLSLCRSLLWGHCHH